MDNSAARLSALIQEEVIRAMGMQAANQIAIQAGSPPPYTEHDFSVLANYSEQLAREIQ